MISELQVPWHCLSYLVVDVEGTGQRTPEIVEFAATIIEGGKIGEVATFLIKPKSPITAWATSFHGIRNSDVANAPTLEKVVPKIESLIQDRCFVAHNLPTELAVLRPRISQWNVVAELDTLWGARRAFPKMSSYALSALASALNLSSQEGAHRAGFDSHLTSLLLLEIADKLKPSSAEELISACTNHRTTQSGLLF